MKTEMNQVDFPEINFSVLHTPPATFSYRGHTVVVVYTYMWDQNDLHGDEGYWVNGFFEFYLPEIDDGPNRPNPEEYLSDAELVEYNDEVHGYKDLYEALKAPMTTRYRRLVAKMLDSFFEKNGIAAA